MSPIDYNEVFSDISHELSSKSLQPPYHFPFSMENYLDLCEQEPHYSFSVVASLPAVSNPLLYAHMVQMFLDDMTEAEQLFALQLAKTNKWLEFMRYCASADEFLGFLPETAKLRRLMRFFHADGFMMCWDWQEIDAPSGMVVPVSGWAKGFQFLNRQINKVLLTGGIIFLTLSGLLIAQRDSTILSVFLSALLLLFIFVGFSGLILYLGSREQLTWNWFVIRKWQWLSITYPDLLASDILKKWMMSHQLEEAVDILSLKSLKTQKEDYTKRWARLGRHFSPAQIEEMRLLALFKKHYNSFEKLFSAEELGLLTDLTPDRIIQMSMAEILRMKSIDEEMLKTYHIVSNSWLSPFAAEARVTEGKLILAALASRLAPQTVASVALTTASESTSASTWFCGTSASSCLHGITVPPALDSTGTTANVVDAEKRDSKNKEATLAASFNAKGKRSKI